MAKIKKPEYLKFTVSELESQLQEASDSDEIAEILDALIFKRKQQLLQLTDQKSIAKIQKSEQKGFWRRIFG